MVHTDSAASAQGISAMLRASMAQRMGPTYGELYSSSWQTIGAGLQGVLQRPKDIIRKRY